MAAVFGSALRVLEAAQSFCLTLEPQSPTLSPTEGLCVLL